MTIHDKRLSNLKILEFESKRTENHYKKKPVETFQFKLKQEVQLYYGI